MRSFITSTMLLVLLIGVASAFFRPAVPIQAETGGAVNTELFGLDNPAIEEDKNISPARKCGFCMG